MKIFALYIKINLTEKPEWFGEFLKKYYEPVDLHITLIQPRYIDEKQTDDLQARVTEAIKKIDMKEENKEVFFDKLIMHKGTDVKYIFMLGCRENSFLTNLQKELRLALEGYNSYVKDIANEYEINFKPHITVAINLDEQTKKEAEKYFSAGYRFEGLLEELILPVVKDQTLEEKTNINNKRIFKL